MNKQKTIHEDEPSRLPRGRSAKRCSCGTWFSLPACHASSHASCTAKCAAEKRWALISTRNKPCTSCGQIFLPRKNQRVAKYCSKKCSLNVARTTEAYKAAIPRAVARRKETYQPKKGPENSQWTGGTKATAQRRIVSGKMNDYRKKYVEKNPHKVREWRHNRSGKKLGRLPNGTVAKLMELQRGKCANCKCSIREKYHMDHIVSIHKGGLHEPLNIQLLCPSCNVRKWALDPIDFAQRNGRLL